MKRPHRYIKYWILLSWLAISRWFDSTGEAASRWLRNAYHKSGLRSVGRLLGKLWDKRHVISREFKHKQRFVVMDSVTYKEKWAFQLSAINIFVMVGISVIALIAVTTIIIAFTPLRELIPGYANAQMTEQTYQNALVIDSLEQQLEQQELMMGDIKDILMGRDPALRHATADSIHCSQQAADDSQPKKIGHSDADTALRKEIEEQDRYALRTKSKTPKNATAHHQETDNNVPAILLFTPTKGKVISSYDPRIRHYGVDIAGAVNESIKAVASGTVIFSNFTTETGYIIAIQHPGGMISVYKHNNALLKHDGDVVRAGEPIAFLGNSGTLTTGPHLHFELWVNGKPVNPLTYISF